MATIKSFRFLSLCLQASLISGSLGFWTVANAADAKANAKASSSTNLFSLEVTVPQSVFEFNAKDAKDPFFPLSTRTRVVQPTITEPVFKADLFKLKGLAGTADSALALINNRTLATGETSTVTTTAGKYKIHLLQIKKVSAVIRVEGQFEPIEIFLPKSDQ